MRKISGEKCFRKSLTSHKVTIADIFCIFMGAENYKCVMFAEQICCYLLQVKVNILSYMNLKSLPILLYLFYSFQFQISYHLFQSSILFVYLQILSATKFKFVSIYSFILIFILSLSLYNLVWFYNISFLMSLTDYLLTKRKKKRILSKMG